MEHKGVSKVVRLLQAGTTLTAISDSDEDVQGVVEAYRFVQYTQDSGTTSYEVEYRIKWDDGLYEYISWTEADTYSPKRPVRSVNNSTSGNRESVNA